MATQNSKTKTVNVTLGFVFCMVSFAHAQNSLNNGVNINATVTIATVGSDESTSSGTNAFVQATLNTGCSDAFASAAGSAALAAATNTDLCLPKNPSASATFLSNFTVIGNPRGVTLPLSFNFQLDGSLNCNSEAPPPIECAASGGSGLLTFFMEVNGLSGLRRNSGTASFVCDKGVTRTTITGSAIESGGGVDLSLLTTIRQDTTTFPLIRTDFDFIQSQIDSLSQPQKDSLGLGAIPSVFFLLTEGTTLQEFQAIEDSLTSLAGFLSSALNVFGLPRLAISSGEDIRVGFSPMAGFSNVYSVQSDIVSTGSVNFSISASATSTASCNASGSASFGNTFVLTSVTVTSEIEGVNLDSLRLVFDSGLEMPVTIDSPTSVDGDVPLGPESFVLFQNYPNPFNPATQISYSLASSTSVRLTVYDLLGGKVATLVNEFKQAGSYSVRFDASGLPNGVYVYELEAGPFKQAKRMIVLK